MPLFARPFHRDACVAALLVLFAVVLPAGAQPGPVSGFSFLRLEPSARAAALGGAFAAVYGDDVNILFYNPAGLNAEMHRSLSVSYLNHVAGLSAGFVGYGRHYEGLGTFGAGLRFLGYGDLEGADETGEPTGTFGASDVALTLGFARAYDDRFRYGLNLHTLFSSIDRYNAAALAVDAGVLYHFPGQRLTFSASLNNAGVTLNSLGDDKDTLPWDLRVGVAKRLQHVPILLSVTGYNLNDPGASSTEDPTPIDDVLGHLAFGAEFQFSDAFNLRFGYNHRQHQNLRVKSRLDLAGLGAGFGLRVSRVQFDYAFRSWSSLGGLHQFTVRTRV